MVKVSLLRSHVVQVGKGTRYHFDFPAVLRHDSHDTTEVPRFGPPPNKDKPPPYFPGVRVPQFSHFVLHGIMWKSTAVVAHCEVSATAFDPASALQVRHVEILDTKKVFDWMLQICARFLANFIVFHLGKAELKCIAM